MTPLLVALLVLAGAGAPPGAVLLPRYDVRAPAAQWRLPAALREVSGLAFAPGGELLAHDDERGALHQLDLRTGAVRRTVRLVGARRGDFEDLAVIGDRLFLATSDGTIVETRWPAAGDSAQVRVTPSAMGGRCEVESLAPAADGAALVTVCKRVPGRADALGLVILRWPLATQRWDTARPLRVRLGTEVRASALARDAASGHWLLLAGRERLLLEFDPHWRLVARATLGRRHHPQAEGLALGPDGTLYVGDEGGKGDGTVTLYRPR